jgi:hypothetical protein
MICFTILAHENEEALAAQIENIRKFNPNCHITVYNGGSNSRFAQTLNVEICPYSRPVAYGNLTHYLLDVMKWLEECGMEYDYLVNLDHDVLFIKEGFGQFVEESMRGYDCMGVHFLVQNTPHDYPEFGPGLQMWREWHRWQPFFQTEYFLRFFNPGQIYRPQIIKRMLAAIDMEQLENLLSSNQVFALEEMFFPTLAVKCGAKIRGYPWDYEESLEFVRHQGNITAIQVHNAWKKQNYFWIHPVKGHHLKHLSEWIIGTDN